MLTLKALDDSKLYWEQEQWNCFYGTLQRVCKSYGKSPGSITRVSFSWKSVTLTGDLSPCPYNQGVCNSVVFTKWQLDGALVCEDL